MSEKTVQIEGLGPYVNISGRHWFYFDQIGELPERTAHLAAFVGDPVEDRDRLVACVLANIEELQRRLPTSLVWSRSIKREIANALRHMEVEARDILRFGGLVGEPAWCPECHVRGSHLGSCSRSTMRAGPPPGT